MTKIPAAARIAVASRDASNASAAWEALCSRPPPQSRLERTATEFLKEWLRYAEDARPWETEEYMKGICNAIWQIREVCKR